MATEYVLLLGIYGFILLGAFVGDKGPGATFLEAGPRLSARVERNLATGRQFQNAKTGRAIIQWQKPTK